MCCKFYFHAVVSILLVGCSGVTTPPRVTETASPAATLTPRVMTATSSATVTPTHRPAKSETPTATPNLTLLPTIKPFAATSTVTIKPTVFPTFTPTVLPDARLDFQCLEITTSIPMTGTYIGTVVLGGYTETLSYQLDLSTWVMKPLLEGNTGKTIYEAVSPNRKWLAYKPYNTNELIITTIDDHVQPLHIPWEEDWRGIKGWLNNQNLQIFIDGGLLVLNPFTGESRKLPENFPDLGQPIGVGADWWDVSYNPSLTRVVYPRDPGDVHGNRIVLWNMQTTQAVTYLTSRNNPYGGEPVWSPSGDEFVMTLEDIDLSKGTLDDELYRVSQDGQNTLITNLSAYYNKYLSVKKYSWSPDASRIAFWLWYGWDKSFQKDQLAVLDLETLQVTNYCIEGAAVGDHPVWSPDGTQLIIEGRIDKDHLGTILVDLDKKIAIQIAGEFRFAGWMVSP